MPPAALYSEVPFVPLYARLIGLYGRVIGFTVASACLLGLLLTAFTPSRYRAQTRLLVLHANAPTNAPLDALFAPPVDSLTQAEMLQNPALLADVARDTRLSLAALHLQAKPVVGTDLLELTCEAATADAARRFVTQWPAAYRASLIGEQQEQIRRAEATLRQRLHTAQISAARSAPPSQPNAQDEAVTVRMRFWNDAHDARMQARQAEAALHRQQVRVQSLTQALHNQPATLRNHLTRPSPRAEAIQTELARLQMEQARLDVLLTPEHTDMQQVAAQIAHLKAELRQQPAAFDSVTETANPLHDRLEIELTEAKAAFAEAHAAAETTRENVRTAEVALQKQERTARPQRTAPVMETGEQETVTALTRELEELRWRADSLPDPIRIVSPAQQAEKIAPKPLLNLLYAALIGLALGITLVLLQTPMPGGVATLSPAVSAPRPPATPEPVTALDEGQAVVRQRSPERDESDTGASSGSPDAHDIPHYAAVTPISNYVEPSSGGPL